MPFARAADRWFHGWAASLVAILLLSALALAPALANAADDDDEDGAISQATINQAESADEEANDETDEEAETVDRDESEDEAADDELEAKADAKKAEKANKRKAAKVESEEEESEDAESAREKPADDKAKDEQAKDEKSEDAKPDADKADKEKKEEPKPVVTHHTATIAGKKIKYTATAGKMVMKDDEGEPKANVFFIAYTKDHADGDRDAVAQRPVTYCFNGGPGSASVWLHLGMLGPMRVKLDSHGGTRPPPHELIPNEYSLLDVTDLVFIDPVSTGFSRPVKGQDKKQFHGFDEDVRSVGQFIHDYTTKYNRWKSPKFVLGESYGGIRSAGLSGELQDRYNMNLNGIVLVSAVIDFQTLMTGGNNDIAYVLFLPAYAATAWYHKALGEELQEQSLEEVVDAAREFAAGPYLRALMAGTSLTKERRQDVVERMAELTGLSEDYVDASNLRVPMSRFGKELLRSRGLIVGRFDSRYTGIALDRVGDRADYDPSASAVSGSFTSALNEYLRETLGVEEERVYEILTSQVQPWDYSEFTNRFVDASQTLRGAMTENPHLRVFAACGYYDLATPAFAMEYTRNHLDLAPELQDHFQLDYYEAGHMMYTHEPSLVKLRKDLLKFYEETLEPLHE